jgi:hypothetical protein
MAYDKIEDQSERPEPTMSPEDAVRLRAFLVKENIRFSTLAASPVGRRAVQDFNLERVLDRLLVYERRIEHSLYRTMAELRKLRKEGGIVSSMGAGSQTQDGASGVPSPPMTAADDTHGQACPEPAEGDAHATEPPEGGTPNESCETNPIGAGSSVGGIPNDAPAQEESRQTNPIGTGVPAGAGPGGAEVWSDLAPGEIRQTKPIQGSGSMPGNTPSRPRRIRKFPNTVNEETYDSYLGRWVWTGYAFANKDSDQADSGRHQ